MDSGATISKPIKSTCFHKTVRSKEVPKHYFVNQTKKATFEKREWPFSRRNCRRVEHIILHYPINHPILQEQQLPVRQTKLSVLNLGFNHMTKLKTLTRAISGRQRWIFQLLSLHLNSCFRLKKEGTCPGYSFGLEFINFDSQNTHTLSVLGFSYYS